MDKLFFYDTETTGLFYDKNAIHQLSGLIVIDGEVIEDFDYKIAPHKTAVIEESALKVSNVTEEQIKAYPSPEKVHGELLAMLARYCNKYDKNDKFHLIGYNNRRFDDLFFRYFFVKLLNDKYFGSWFWNDTIDVLVLASNYLRLERSDLGNFKLMEVAKHLGIDIDESKLHDAIYDSYITKAIYDIVGK